MSPKAPEASSNTRRRSKIIDEPQNKKGPELTVKSLAKSCDNSDREEPSKGEVEETKTEDLAGDPDAPQKGDPITR